MKAWWVLLIAVAVSACAAPSARVYRGTYIRTWVDEHEVARQREGNVVLELRADGLYRLWGDAIDHPPAREGRYRETESGLEFMDMTVPTAGFSLHLIVDGTFEAARDGDDLVLLQPRPADASRLFLLRLDHP